TLYLLGYLAYLIPVLIAQVAWLVYRWQKKTGRIRWDVFVLRVLGFVITVISGAVLASLHIAPLAGTLPLSSGGILGNLVGSWLEANFSFVGATLLALAVFLAGVTVFSGLSWIQLMDLMGRLALHLVQRCTAAIEHYQDSRAQRRIERKLEQPAVVLGRPARSRQVQRIEPMIKEPRQVDRGGRQRQMPLFEDVQPGSLPPTSLLDSAREQQPGYSREALESMSRRVEDKLRDFAVQVNVVAVQPGPVITRFEVQPAPGVKVSQISNLAKDLARALSVTSLRVVEVIPGKSVVGLEIPNEKRQVITLAEVIEPALNERSAPPLSLAIGKDIGGHPVIVDLAKMPHLLVAGTTGSGKSVGINTMILSLLYRNQPATMRTIMIDPKMLELSVYDGIPHLLAPVVTDMKEAANALRWCVAEMERRYRLMATLGVRNVAGCNRKIREAIEHGSPIRDPSWVPPEPLVIGEPLEHSEPPLLDPLPYIVVLVDEFADMMMMVGKKVEELIARLAQKARAAGIHLILATQRPSVDVITGLIKANIPTRMAFQVSSKVDSRTILDQMGAESLLGHGDMLYIGPSSRGIPQRVHGAFASDAEVHRVVEYLKCAGEPEYIDEILDEPGASAPAIPGLSAQGGDGESDPLYDQAVRIVTETRRASISGVQRRLKIGYNRAARLVEEMESAGVVGPLQPNGAREILAPPPPE
ncbi:MAG: DNA translocase FtsK 4TM domain-containing protein, partial [Nitrococcus sp.]|nr:DNA translocase FtsK 4TM domain-containing protein [Nitrococcus sp.]